MSGSGEFGNGEAAYTMAHEALRKARLHIMAGQRMAGNGAMHAAKLEYARAKDECKFALRVWTEFKGPGFKKMRQELAEDYAQTRAVLAAMARTYKWRG